jgi:MFS family permease
MIREPQEEVPRERETGLWENLRSLPQVVAGDREMRRWLWTSAFGGLAAAVVPYLGIHAVHGTGQGDSFLGRLIAWQMGGAVVGGLLAGWAGDRWGARPVCIAARLGWLAVCAGAPLAAGATTWCWLFALFGAAMTAGNIGMHALQLAILPAHGRANRLAVMAAAQLPIALTAGLGAAAVWSAWSHTAFTGLALGCLVLSALSVLPLLRIREPARAQA